MKKIVVGIFYFCILSLNAWGINIPEEDNVTKVIRLLREVEERVNTNHEEGTIFLGNTSAGKSTLFNYMQRVPLYGRKKGFGKYEIALAPEANEKDCSTIGFSSTVSQTTLPVIIGNNFDSPGFQDTRDFQDIVNAYSIYRIMNQTRNLRVLLVSTLEEIRSTKGNYFFNLLDQVGEIFQNNIDTLCQNLCFVITKVNGQQINKEEYKGLFTTMLEEQLGTGLGNENPRIKILRFLSERSDRIGFFKMPDREGLLPEDDRVAIQTMLDATPYQGNIKPILSLSAKSRLAVNGLISGIFDEMRRIITDLSERYPELYENFIQSNLNKKASKIRKELRKVSDMMTIVSDSLDNFCVNATAVESVLNRLGHKDRKLFKEYCQRLAFFTEVGVKEQVEQEIERYRLFSSLEQFRRDTADFIEINPRENNTILTGFLLGISDLNEFLRRNTLSEVAVHSLNTLLIDEDLIEPGLNLTLIAPKWRIIGNKTISLKGRNGLAHDNIRARDGDASSSHGDDGIPGKSGESGGHFYGRGKIFQGLEHLTINTSGGQGGPGQHGGRGANGKDGLVGNKEDVEKRKQEYLVESTTPWKTIKYALPLLTLGNSGTFDTYRSGIEGEPGGNGGKGGRGGEAGQKGMIALEGALLSPIQRKESAGERGNDGSHGDPGLGGQHKPIYEGTYIDIKMFGAHQHILKEVINNTIGAEENRKYGWFGKLSKKIFGCGGCLDLVQYGVTGGVIAIEIGFEVLKMRCLYDLAGPYLVTAELIFTGATKRGYWYVKPHEKDIKKTAEKGAKPTSYNVDDIELTLPRMPINIVNKKTHYEELYEQYNRSKLVISFDL